MSRCKEVESKIMDLIGIKNEVFSRSPSPTPSNVAYVWGCSILSRGPCNEPRVSSECVAVSGPSNRDPVWGNLCVKDEPLSRSVTPEIAMSPFNQDMDVDFEDFEADQGLPHIFPGLLEEDVEEVLRNNEELVEAIQEVNDQLHDVIPPVMAEGEAEHAAEGEAEHGNVHFDSGYESIDSDDDTIIERDEGVRGPDFQEEENNESSDSDIDVEQYDPQIEGDQEARLRRILGLRRQYWRAKYEILRIERKRDFRRMERQIQRIRERRQRYNRVIPERERRRMQARNRRAEDRPHRGQDRCFGCAKLFWLQRARRWARCEDCGSWLCPDCNEEPDHCRNDGGLL